MVINGQGKGDENELKRSAHTLVSSECPSLYR